MAIVLSMLFMVSILPAIPAFAAYEGSCGEGVTYLFDQSTGTLTISGNGKMKNYYNETPWCFDRSLIKSVTIENGVTEIGFRAFYGCSGLTSVTISSSVTEIGEDVFVNCINLESVNYLGNTEPEHEEEEYIFSGCIRLSSVNVTADYEGDNFCGMPVVREH